MLTLLRVLSPVTTIVANGSSFIISSICDSMPLMIRLSTNHNDARLFKIMISYSEPGVPEPARN